MSGLKDFVIVFLTLTAIVGVATAALLFILSPIGSYACKDYGKMVGFEVHYNVLAAKCYVNYNGVWVDKSKLLGVHNVSR